MNTVRLAVISAVLITSTALTGQTVTPHRRTCPKAFAGWQAPSANWMPLGRTRGFMQVWYRGDQMHRLRPVFEFGIRADRGASAPATSQKIEVTLADSKKTFSNIDKTFANNLTTPTVFVKLRTINMPAISGSSNPNAPVVWIKGDRPFIFRGPNFVVQYDVRTTNTFSYVSRAYADSFSRPTAVGISGRSCGSGALAGTLTGGTWRLTLSGLQSGKPGIFFVGVENQSFGGLLMPVDLGSAGMPGCGLGVVPMVQGVVNANASGVASVALPIPTGSVLVLHAQGVHLDTTKPAGLATTNTASVVTANGICNYVYNWTRSGPSAQYGPYNYNNGQVLLFKP